eukprot:4852127-Pyramimonas_sp.AAC.1
MSSSPLSPSAEVHRPGAGGAARRTPTPRPARSSGRAATPAGAGPRPALRCTASPPGAPSP